MTRFRARPNVGSWPKTRQWIASKRRLRPALAVLLGFLHVTVLVQGTWGHGDRSEYLARLDAKIETDPDSVPVLLERAEAHRRLGHYDESLADLDRASAVSPGNHRVHYHRGLTLFDRGELGEAENALRRYLQSAPGSPSGHIALAETLMRQDRHLAAANEYTLAIANQPTPIPDHFIAQAKAYRAAGEDYLDVAGDALDEGMSLLGPLVTLQRLAVEIEIDRGNHAGAITRIDHVLAKASRKETWLVHKARILASMDRQRDAIDAFRLAREAIRSLPGRMQSSPAMIDLQQTISDHLDKDTVP
ncbi:MAG: tetratricopeptide repeat protein [Gammaproteobacteria bacterium]|nr:tetratricopeptide repeat protein [Gammaproteobacteria bacterium]